ncbi:queuine tRNA-ribosyltransferase subunit qtrtd1-like, partial [Notothenia coriiceps]|uniref:Queuine tRNA-ribosyltransferase subunit qtrtd1-like n=1 Tax=Notothenia coriiceps TaxID=8208 RepID=A0A6I9PS49_9TELE
MAGCRMKLELSRVALGKGRLGVLKGLGKTGQLSLEVPGCLLHTHLGTVPHLTQDTLSTLSTLPSVTQITLSNIAEHQEVLEEFKVGFRKFAGTLNSSQLRFSSTPPLLLLQFITHHL